MDTMRDDMYWRDDDSKELQSGLENSIEKMREMLNEAEAKAKYVERESTENLKKSRVEADRIVEAARTEAKFTVEESKAQVEEQLMKNRVNMELERKEAQAQVEYLEQLHMEMIEQLGEIVERLNEVIEGAKSGKKVQGTDTEIKAS